MTNRSCANCRFWVPTSRNFTSRTTAKNNPLSYTSTRFFFFIISSGQVWRFCLSNFVSGSLQLEISVTAYLESSFFQGCAIIFRAVPQLSWIWFHQKPEWMIIIQSKIPLWDIRADVIGRQDNRIILLHRAVTSFLVRSLLVQHILLNWDVLLIRSLLRQSF